MRIHESGFTLAELLIALVVLGVIATFTIPKIIQSQQDNKFKSIGKEAAGMISEAYSAYKLRNTNGAGTKPTDFTPYMNYVEYDATTANRIDDIPANPALSCLALQPCIELHSGAVMRFTLQSFGGTENTNAIRFYVDPDGVYSGSPTGNGKSVVFFLYYNGRLGTRKTIETEACDDSSCRTASPTGDPDWFDWN